MKLRILSLLLGMGMLTTWIPQAEAAPHDSAGSCKSMPKCDGGKLSPVAKALKEAGYLSEHQAKPRAKFYIFFCSASWCGICQQMMPQVIEQYEQKISQNEDVELILLNHDQTTEAAREYMKQHAPMLPGAHVYALQLEAKPTYKYIPACFIMTARGELVSAGGGDVFLNWETEIQKKPEKSTGNNKRKRR
ncbi:MAG: hypothetical protein J6J97_04440 [Akkermansia sp.]|nr:hypothetical protein [Akkermansia sp.]